MRYTPTLVLTDHGGRKLTESIVGYQTPSLYGYYLDEAIADARQVLGLATHY